MKLFLWISNTVKAAFPNLWWWWKRHPFFPWKNWLRAEELFTLVALSNSEGREKRNITFPITMLCSSVSHNGWKLIKKSHLNSLIWAFSNKVSPIKSYLSGKRSSLRSQCWMRLFLWFFKHRGLIPKSWLKSRVESSRDITICKTNHTNHTQTAQLSTP